MTDAYFHFTPSQIMLAALSLADHELAERVIHETFQHAAPNSTGLGTAPPNQLKEGRRAAAASEERARLLGADVRERVLAAVGSCRDMLSKEPPERLTAYWDMPDAKQISRPLLRKLKKCRDPDRWDLVALQKARREQNLRKGFTRGVDGGDNSGSARGTIEDDATVFGDADGRDTKRRKVTQGLEDPFGGPL